MSKKESKNKPVHDYALLDKKFPATFRKDKLSQAKKLGYNHISQATIELYRKHQSQRIVGEILNMTERAIGYRLEKYKEPRRPSGGLPGKAGRKFVNQKSGQL